ncbi:IS5 family transposase [Myxococcus xanthus]|uniref:IS5 family transposase n=1 Tax=Myxococcus xanthus TaxID=34 RepID=UPI0019174CD4|nr:IS5 family transposase [Myxococcus xanthus]QQR45745.1 IS5 family transposase [Myxococcus xanthus]
MRGEVKGQSSFSLVQPAQRVPPSHPIRRIKALADAQLAALSPVFDAMYSGKGRPSIPPEVLLKACPLIALYSVRSERQFCERLEYDLLFRFFLDMSLDAPGFDASSFAKNKQRLLDADVARRFFEGVVGQARGQGLMSAEHFTVDGTLIEAWAGVKSFKKKGSKDKGPPDDKGNPTVNFHREKRSNATHESTTDPESRLARKGGNGAKLCYSASVLMENRTGLVADITVELATGEAEWVGALRMLDRQKQNGLMPTTLGADAGYDVQRFVDATRERGMTPHVAQTRDVRRASRVDGRTTRHAGYALSQRARKRVEEIFGWMKTVGGFIKTRYRGQSRTGLWAYFVAAAYNLTRMARLIAA